MKIKKLLDLLGMRRRVGGGAGGGEGPGEGGARGPGEQAEHHGAGVGGARAGDHQGSSDHFWGAGVITEYY